MKGYRDNGGGGGGFGRRNTTVYDDVFGGPPKFGATTLPPRLEDYTEIFQGFHASRGSSIPYLDLPPPAGDSADSGDVWFDVPSSKLDYSEVFGGFNGLDFAVSYEELFKSSKVRDEDSSDDVWTPAQSESLSDESDPYASLEMKVPTTDPNQLFGVKSHNEPNVKADKDLLNGMANDPQMLDIPQSTALDNQSLTSKIENESFYLLDKSDFCASKDTGEVVAEGKQLKKSFSQPLERYESDPSHLAGNQKGYAMANRPLFSVSDLGLKTQPSHLPPPSRPPPSLTSKEGDFGNFNSKLKTSKSYAFERVTGDRSPPYFDVEIDASSSAAADAAAMKDAVEQAQAKLRSAKELMDRKKEGLQSRSKLRMENNVEDKKGRVNVDFERSNGFGGERTKGIAKHELRQKDQTDAEILEPNVRSRGFQRNNKTVLESFEQKEDCKIVQEGEFFGLEESNERQETLDRCHREEEDLKEPTVAHKTCKLRETNKRFFVSQQLGETRTSNVSDDNELYENLIEIQLKDNDMEAVEKVVTESWLKNDNGRKGEDIGSASYVWEDYDEGLEEAIEKGLKETEKKDGREFQQSGPPESSIMQSEEEGERIVKDPFEWEESDDMSETVSEQGENKKEQTLDHNEKILHEEVMQEEDKKIKAEAALEEEGKKEMDCETDDNVQTLNHDGASEKIKTINEMDCNSEENRKLQDLEREESEKSEETISESNGIENEQEGIKWDENESITGENSETSDVVFQVDANEILQATRDLYQDNEKVEETVEQIHEVSEKSFSSSGINPNDLQGVKVEVRTEDVTASNLSNENAGKTPTVNDKKTCESKNGINFTCNQAGSHPEGRPNTTPTTTKSQTVQVDSLRNTVQENRGKEERLQRARELENERLRKIEEERERQIEREKDRMAVDRATLEARERAFAETRERTERTAVERTTAEFRQRALAEARERLEKACAEARERSLAEKAMEGRLRVEKATAEARERAVGDKLSNYQNSGMRQNSLPSVRQNSLPADLGRSYSGLRYSQTATQSGGGGEGEGESPQRCKARLERHQRTADRAAKALAEKNMRDLVAQKEQAERSRLADGLDAEVKRWSSGKQGNLRALLSTLQYILGSDSGWQPVPLTEVITTAAVKKAYRKATLCVHPDKLQQRGATIQQKYICEKVFDLLKEAWNKFNSEER